MFCLVVKFKENPIYIRGVLKYCILIFNEVLNVLMLCIFNRNPFRRKVVFEKNYIKMYALNEAGICMVTNFISDKLKFEIQKRAKIKLVCFN